VGRAQDRGREERGGRGKGIRKMRGREKAREKGNVREGQQQITKNSTTKREEKHRKAQVGKCKRKRTTAEEGTC